MRPSWLRAGTEPGSRFARAIPEMSFVFFTTAAGLWAQGRWLNPISDPGLWWSMTERLARGERLYRDVWFQYGPLSPYLMAFGGRVFGCSALFIILVNWIPAIILGILLLRAARDFFSLAERLCVAMLVIALGVFGPARAHLVLSYSPAAVQALCLSVAALLLVRRERPSRLLYFLAGTLAGLALCAKQEIGLGSLLALGALFLVRRRSLFRAFLWIGLGFAWIAIGGALFVLSQASLDSLRYESHLWPIGTFPESWRYLSRLAAGWTQDLPLRLGWAVLGLAYVLLVVTLSSRLATRGSRSRGTVLALCLAAALIGGWICRKSLWELSDPLVLSSIAAVAVAVFALADRKVEGREFLVAFGLFAAVVSLRAAFSGSVLWSSYSGVAFVCTAVTWCVLLFLFAPPLLAGPSSAAAFRAVIMIVVLLISVRGAWRGALDLVNPDWVAVPTSKGTVWMPPDAAGFFRLLSENLHPGERVLPISEPHGVEALLDVRNAAPLPLLMPGWLDERAEQKLLQRYQKEPPDAVIFFARGTVEFGVAPFGIGYGRQLSAWILSNYRLVTRTSPKAPLERPGALLRR